MKFACKAKFSIVVKLANEICFESEQMFSSAMQSVHPVFNRPGVSGAVLQSPSSLID